MITAIIPATTANLGSGFDSFGVALTMYNRVSMELSDRLDIRATDGFSVPEDERNMVYIAARRLFEVAGREVSGLKIRQTSNIPMARGLGSSSACIAGGLLCANVLLGNIFDKEALADLAAEIEGHPDNVIPALFGGAAVCAMNGGRAWHGKIELPDELAFAAFIPDFSLRTSDAREALPKTVPLSSATFNLSRSGLLSYALINRRWDMLRVACDDRLHSRYRLQLIPGGEKIIDQAYAQGAYAAFISGSGSTVMAAYPASDGGFAGRMKDFAGHDEQTARFTIKVLAADNIGATVETEGAI